MPKDTNNQNNLEKIIKDISSEEFDKETLEEFKNRFKEFLENKEEYIKYRKRKAELQDTSTTEEEVSDFLIDWYRLQFSVADKRINSVFEDIDKAPASLLKQIDYIFFDFLDNLFYVLDKIEEWKKKK